MLCAHGQHYSPKALPSRVEQTETNLQQRSAVVVFIELHSNLVAHKFLSHFKCQAPYPGANFSLVTSHINMSHDWTDSSRNNAARGILKKHNSSVLSMKRVLSHHSDHMSESTVLCVKTAVTSAYFIPHFV